VPLQARPLGWERVDGKGGGVRSEFPPRRLRDQPAVVLCLAAAIAVAHLVRLLLPGRVQDEALAALAVIPARFDALSPYAFAHPWETLGPLFGHVFLHAGFLHLLMNLFVFIQFGGALAWRLDQRGDGVWRFLVLFFGCAAASAVCFILLNRGSETPALGASGAICGMFAGYLLAAPAVWSDAFRDPRVLRAGFWFLLVNVGLAAAARATGILPIAWEAHLGGFLGGLVLYPFVAPKRR
jgi:membrane associated rhomboid family serine protease